jgi:hypothetical protein
MPKTPKSKKSKLKESIQQITERAESRKQVSRDEFQVDWQA